MHQFAMSVDHHHADILLSKLVAEVVAKYAVIQIDDQQTDRWIGRGFWRVLTNYASNRDDLRLCRRAIDIVFDATPKRSAGGRFARL